MYSALWLDSLKQAWTGRAYVTPTGCSAEATIGLTTRQPRSLKRGPRASMDGVTAWRGERMHRAAIGLTALRGDAAQVRTLLEWGADVNAKSSRGTPLIYAAGSDRARPETIRLLLEYGADLNVVAQRCDRCIHEPRADDDGMAITALMLARQRGQTDIVRLLIDAGAKR